MLIKNPLRYPGAKSKLVPYIQCLIEAENLKGCTLYEPYAGSAAISLNLLYKNIIANTVINELDPLVYNFWLAVMDYTDELINKIVCTEINLDTWNRMSLYRDNSYAISKSVVDIGFAGLFLNRTNFSGILKANPLGGKNQVSDYPIDCRFNKDRIIESIRSISKLADRVRLYNMDAIDFLKLTTKYKRNNKIFVYVDPPYFQMGQTLYRYYYDNKQHNELAKYIKTKSFPWLISYDNAPEISKLYKCRNRIQLYLDYSVRTSRKGNELLISNLEIPPIEVNIDEAIVV